MSTFDIEDKLRAAARTIDCMPEADLTESLSRMKQTLGRRSSLDRARARTELESMELDQAAYDLALQHEADEDLIAAAHWYRAAAMNDFADASFRLAKVLDALAERCLAQPSSQTTLREEMDFVVEAARWYVTAYGAGHLEAAGRIDMLIARHDLTRPRGVQFDPAPSAPPSRDSHGCKLGGLQAVVANHDLRDAAAHFSECSAKKSYSGAVAS
jgi:hypothetical protein